MPITTAALVEPTIDLLTLSLTCVSGYFVYRQNTTLYREVKTLLIYVHIFFSGVLILELLRNFVSAGNTLFLDVYTVLGTSFILWDVLLLMTVGAAVYLRPEGSGVRDLLRSIMRQRFAGGAYTAIAAFIIASDIYLAVFLPFTPTTVYNIGGLRVISPELRTPFLLVVLIVLLLFLTYPTTLFILARANTKDRQVRRALILLPIVWGGIGIDLVIFNGFLLTALKVDYVAVGYLFASIAFAVTATIFRRASLLSGFFGPVSVSRTSAPTFPFSRSISINPATLVGRSILFEIDPSYNYEQALANFSIELLSNNALVFVFTSKRSPIYNSLSKTKGVRFYTLTSSVSYPRGTEVPEEILVPQNDQAILLDIIHKTIVTDPEAKMGIIYDNISDLILSSNVESTYKFLKQANEIIDLKRVATVFLFTPSAHDEKTVNLIRTLFTNHVSMTSAGPKLVRE